MVSGYPSCFSSASRQRACCFGVVSMLACVLVVSVWGICGATLPGLGSVVPDSLPGLGSVVPDSLPGIIPNPVNLIFQNKCIEAVGCFYTGPPFYHPINRPVSLTPTTVLKTRYLLFTPTHPREEQELHLTPESIKNSSFDANLPVKVLIHGFMADLDVDDIRFKIKNALLNYSDYNVIVVDWTEHNGMPYPQALANARAVGAQLANLLKLIMETSGTRPQDIHIIGHSLGAQMAGWTGERIPNLGRITGLDPAGPFFQDGANEIRLDATDALFVDIIHTDGGENFLNGLGISDPVGHMDFYPNGGRRQPGCVHAADENSTSDFMGSIINSTTQWVLSTCDHGRSSQYFLESIDSARCRYLATWCNTYQDFEKGDCLPQNSTLAEMGFHAQRISGVPIKSKFFLRTNKESPFCIQNSVYLRNDE